MNHSTLNFVETGNGKICLIFLHYFGGSSKSWAPVMALLEKSFRCIAIDLRGFGNSPVPGKDLSVNDYANDVLDLIHTLQLENYVLIGHSMGGKISLDIAAKLPAGLRSLILIAPSPATPEPSSPGQRKKLLKAFGDHAAIKKLVNGLTAQPLEENVLEETIQTHLAVSPIAWTGWIEQGSREDISCLMKNIHMPVSIISGSMDTNYSTEFLRTHFLKYFPSASFKEISGGHLLPVEAPLEVAESIKRISEKLT